MYIPPLLRRQHQLSTKIFTQCHADLRQALRDRGESARLALLDSHSHPSCDVSWIRPPHPNAPAAATLSQQQFLEALSLRMLLPPPYLRPPNGIGQRRVCICNAINRQESPVLGHKSNFYHCFSCSLIAKSTQDRHNTVQEVIFLLYF
jgi:hypothetical protein